MADAADIAAAHLERLERERDAAIRARREQVRESAEWCEDCGDDIPEARRSAVPGCKRCAPCQEISERRTPRAI